MAAAIDGVFPQPLQEKIKDSKVLVVGAGGIGCEVLKNLVLCGFPSIDIIDLDTIDLSNLNRQFLFHREHVGKSKAKVARESALQFNPDVEINAYHDSIFSTDYGVNFFKKFNVVLSALDNQAARNHVNRMCLNADVVLIESGTAGYNGQVEVIKRGFSQCYECTPKARQKSFPGCTIRNTPSEPIHCIVWAKHLFNQLFGETVDDEDISPDMADPEAQENNSSPDEKPPTNDGSNGKKDGDEEGKEKEAAAAGTGGNIVRVNTRQWAKECKYDAKALFNKFFNDDIKYLLTMENLWKTRKAPVPVTWEECLKNKQEFEKLKHDYHSIWSMEECAKVFEECLKKLQLQAADVENGDSLVWDKDDQPAMDFVAACANIRAYIFQIGRKSRFEVKSMAGNIIPAIATTNAIIGGLVVMRAFNVLKEEFEQCKSVYSRLRLNPRQQLIIPDRSTIPPNSQCYVCAKEPAIHLRIDTAKMRIKEFRDDVLIKTLNMINPDVEIEGAGTVIISSEEGETEDNDEKLLKDLYIVEGAVLKCDDFFQNYELRMVIMHIDTTERDDALFEVVADKSQLKPKEEKENNAEKESENSKASADDADGPSTSKKRRMETANDVEDDDDDLQLIEDDDDEDNVTDGMDKVTVTSPDKPSAAAAAAKSTLKITEILDDDEDGGGGDADEDVVEITEVLDSDEEDSLEDSYGGDESDDENDDEDMAGRPTAAKRRQLDGGGDEEITEVLDSDEEEENDAPTKRKRARVDNGGANSAADVIDID